MSLQVYQRMPTRTGAATTENAVSVRSVSLVLMVLSIFMAIYAAYNFYNRGEMLQ